MNATRRSLLDGGLDKLRRRLKQYDIAREADCERDYMNDITADFMQETIELLETLVEAVKE